MTAPAELPPAARQRWLAPLWRTPRRPGEAISPWRRAAEGIYRRAAIQAARRPRTVRLAPARVLSVGGLEAGGVGKTPCVLWWARALAPAAPLAIVCRPVGAGAPEEADEVRLLRSKTPPGVAVVAHASKSEAARRAVLAGARVVIVDDGFSHHALERDVDLVLLDARLPLANRHLLPAGPLREPPGSLRRATAIALSRADRASPEEEGRARQEVRRAGYAGPLLRAHHRIVGLRRGAGMGPVAGARVYCLSGLGRPGELAEAALRAGATVVGRCDLADHARPSGARWQAVRAEATRSGAEILISAKDEARLPAEWRADAAVLEMEWEWLPGDEGPEWLTAQVLGEAAGSTPIC